MKISAGTLHNCKLNSVRQHIAHRMWEEEGRPDGRYEITGKPDKVDQFISLMMPLGLLEVARTGVAGITRGAEAMQV